jgi:hypothetical protein
MSTKILRKEPVLPSVRLYLDDIQEITEIVADTYEKAGRPKDLQFKYRVNGEIEFTSLAELEEHGGVAREFQLSIESIGTVLTTDHGLGFSIPYELAGSPAAQDALIRFRLIAFDRRRRLITWFWEMSGSSYLLAISLSLIVASIVLEGLVRTNPVRLFAWTVEVAVPLFYLAGLYIAFHQRDLVNLWFKRSRERERASKRAERIEKVWLLAIGAVLGAAFGVVGTLILQHIKR